MASTKTTNNTTYTTPRTWTTGELVTKSIMDTYVSANTTALKVPASWYIKIDEASDYTTGSTSFTVIGSTEMSASITTAGGTVWVFFSAEVTIAASARVYFDIFVDSVAQTGNDGITAVTPASSSTANIVCLAVPITGLSATSHTFQIGWKVQSSTATLHAGAGTANFDFHPYFSGVEIG